MSDEDHEAVREEIIESFERSAEVYGLSRSAGRIYGVLYFSSDPLSIPELVEETGYAKSTISNVTRQLTRIGMIRRRSSKGGGRRVKFVPQTDIWVIIQEVLQQNVHREMQGTQRTLNRALQQLDALDTHKVQADRERVQELAATYDQLQSLIELAIDHSPAEMIEAIEQYDRD